LDKCLYEPLTISIASSFNLISAYQAEIKSIEKAIEKTIRGLNPSDAIDLSPDCLFMILQNQDF